MKSGTSERTYRVNKTRWIVEGFSNRSQCMVYPHKGWSWTEWKPQISDTYRTLADAREAISCGYLKDMIEQQQIVDIHIFSETVTKEITERTSVDVYNRRGKPVSQEIPKLATDLASLGVGDHLVCGNYLYCRVVGITDNLMRLMVINGGWVLPLDISGPIPFISATAHQNLASMVGEEVPILHLGKPDPDAKDYDYQYGDGDYDHQLSVYRDKFDTGEITSTLRVA